MNPTRLGKYTLIEQCGRGGFGTVFKATDPIGRTVAIKVLKPGWVDDPGVMARFKLEALAAGELFHARIATILDFNEAEDHPFLVMRYVDGQSVDKLLEAKGRLDWETAVQILKEVAEGLDFAHQRGFIHRDVKPANILISEKEGAVLTDFGLVKAAQVSGLSSSEVLLGSPPYIAPEVWGGKRASPATDIYSLACVFYEMITGEILFSGDSSPQIMTRHILEGPQFPSTWPEEIPSDVEKVLRKALMMEPGERYPSATAFASALQVLQHPPTQQPGVYINTIITVPRQKKKKKRNLYLIGSVLGLILLGIIAGGYILMSGAIQHKNFPAMPTVGSLTPFQTRRVSTPTVLNTPTQTPPPPTDTRPLPSPTKTISPTHIPPTSTPTLSLPALVGTAIPKPIMSVSVENAHQVTQLARLGKGSAAQIAWSPDGAQIGIAHSFGIYFFDAQSLQQFIFIDIPVRVLCLAYSPGGDKLAIGRSDHTIQIFNVDEKTILQTLPENFDVVRSIAFTPDGKYLVSGTDDGTIRVWGWEDAKLIHALEGHQKPIWSIAISPDGLFLASGSEDSNINLWNLDSGKRLMTLPGHTGSVNSVAFSPDGKYLASASNDLTLRIWDVSTGKQLRKIQHQDNVLRVAFSPDGKIVATASRDKLIRLWNPDNGSLIRKMIGHRAAVNQIVFSPDGKNLASIGEDGTLGLWQVEDGQILRLAEVATGLVRSVNFSADSQIVVAGTRDGAVELWDVDRGNELKPRHMIHNSQVNSIITFQNNGKLASGSDDNSVKIWTLDGQEIQDFVGSTNHVESVTASTDGLLLAAGAYDGIVNIWCISDRLKLKTIKESGKPIWGVSFSPDNSLLAVASLDGWVRTWKTLDWSPGLKINLGEGISVYSLAFSPDGKVLAVSSGDQGIIRLYQVSDGALLYTLMGHTDQVWSMDFTPDSHVLISGSLDSTIRLWQVSDGTTITVLQDHLNSISSVACSPDGKLIASGSWDGTIRLWGVIP